MPSCLNCGQGFEGKRSDAVYCSNRCAQRGRYARHYEKNRDVIRAKAAERQEKQKEAHMLARIRCRAAKQGIPFDLTVDDIEIPASCPVLGIPLTFNFGKGSGYHDDSPSVDRIVPHMGYTRGNVRIISARANLLKSNAKVWELEAVLADLKEVSRAGI